MCVIEFTVSLSKKINIGNYESTAIFLSETHTVETPEHLKGMKNAVFRKLKKELAEKEEILKNGGG